MSLRCKDLARPQTDRDAFNLLPMSSILVMMFSLILSNRACTHERGSCIPAASHVDACATCLHLLKESLNECGDLGGLRWISWSLGTVRR